MWNKKKLQNLTIWTTSKINKVRVIPDDQEMADLYNNNEGQIEFGMNPRFYWEEQEGQIDKLPAGIYRYEKVDHEMVLVETELQEKDSFIDLSVTKDIEKDFNTFLDSKPVYEKLKMPFRRGVMLFGPPGTGKTFATHNIMKKIIKEDMIAIFSNKSIRYTVNKELQKDSRMKVIIFEEFTNVLRPDWEAGDDLLDFLDGESSLDNTFIIATTNYPEKLPKNIVERPGRFDKFYKVDYLNKDDIRRYLEHYDIKPEPCILAKKDLTIATLKEIMLQTLREGLTFEEALKKLEGHTKLSREEFTDKKLIQFED